MNDKEEYIKLFNSQVGKRLKEFRKQKKVSQDELSKVLGLTRVSISNIEVSRHTMSFANIVKACDYLKISISDLIPKERPSPERKVKYHFVFEATGDREEDVEITIPAGVDETEYVEEEFKDWLHNQFDAGYSKTENKEEI